MITKIIFHNKKSWSFEIELIEIVTYSRLGIVFVWGICVFWLWPPASIFLWQPRPQFVCRGPSPQFVFTSPRPQSVFAGPQPTFCIYRSWLIRIGNNKSIEVAHNVTIFSIYSNFFVTLIGCCSLFFSCLRLLFIINFFGYLCFPTPGHGSDPPPVVVPRSSISIYWSRPSIFIY